MTWGRILNMLPSRHWIVIGFALLIGLGGIDYATGPELSFSIFYLLPVSLIAWFVGWRAGIVAACASAFVWLVVDVLGQQVYIHTVIPYWNALVRLGFFLIVAHILFSLRVARKRQEELLYLIVHDLRSPLSNVKVGLQILRKTSGAGLEAKQQEIIEMCVVSCDGMFRLIDSLLDLARLESGRMPLHLSYVRIGDLVDESLGQVWLWAEQRQVHLTTELHGIEAETIYADVELTKRVLSNLLSNAIKYSPVGATITIRVVPEDHDMAFSVVDQGPGIPAEWAEKVFDKYAQVDPNSLQGVGGSGLGLSFCRQAVEVQGGRIWLDDTRTQGTTITFTLPAKRSVEASG